ncbi:HD domain-containing protein [Enterococcus sp. LJL51]|uniref:HD domain-containing protein n=1 Tax=Enterococcus sp. LJL51 TaxID=3416656 RepID=UPI003CFA21F5
MEQLQRIERYTAAVLAEDQTGHGMDHIQRVVHLAGQIAEREDCNDFIVIAGAYLHDVVDDKLVHDEQEAYEKLAFFLKDICVSEEERQHIFHVLANVSYSKEKLNGKNPNLSLEAKIVQDADRLDALGAIGILRTAYYGATVGHKIHDPELPVQSFISKEEYRKGSTVINHFYEKLLKINEGLHTAHGKKLGQKRHDFLLSFLEEFYDEWV